MTNFAPGRRYANGRNLEYKTIADLELNGYLCIRAAGSKGKADIIAIKPTQTLLIQVKSTNPQLAPAERTALYQLAQTIHGQAIVAHKPPRKPIQYRQLTGTGPRDWTPWVPDQIAAAT